MRLADDTAQLLADADENEPTPMDPALRRLLPDGYRDDPEAAAEFRRFTAEGLAERKIANSSKLVESLSGGGGSRVTVQLDDADADAWLKALTDIRLVLASRLGIEDDGDLGFGRGGENTYRAIVYGWVGYVQESLLRAITAPEKR